MIITNYKNQIITIEKNKDGSFKFKTDINDIEPLSIRYYSYSKKEALKKFKKAIDTELAFFTYFNK